MGGGLLCGPAKAQTTPVQIIGGNNASASSRNVQGMVGIEVNGVGLVLDDDVEDLAEDSFSAFTVSAGVKFPKVSQKFGIGVSALLSKIVRRGQKHQHLQLDFRKLRAIGHDAQL